MAHLPDRLSVIFLRAITWACARSNAVLLGIVPQRVGVPHALAGALCTPNLSNVLLRHTYGRLSHCASHKCTNASIQAVVQGLAEDRGATQATSMPTSRHRRARARTRAAVDRSATPTATCQRIGTGGPTFGQAEDGCATPAATMPTCRHRRARDRTRVRREPR